MSVVLSLYPNSRGLGYVCIEEPQSLLDFGIVTGKPISNRRIMERVRKFLDYYKPTIVLVRDAQPYNRRICRLLEDIAGHAEQLGLSVYRYSRQQIKETFEVYGASTKYEVSRKLADWFPVLNSRAPKVRKAWMDEDYNMGIFDAVSLALTHQHLMK